MIIHQFQSFEGLIYLFLVLNISHFFLLMVVSSLMCSLILDYEFRITGRSSLRRYLALSISCILRENLFYFCQEYLPENILNWTVTYPLFCSILPGAKAETDTFMSHLLLFYEVFFFFLLLVRLPIGGIFWKPGIFFRAMWPWLLFAPS